MDAVESPVAATVVVQKVLDPGGFGGVGEGGRQDLSVGSSGADAGRYTISKASSESCFHKDTKHSITSSKNGVHNRCGNSDDVHDNHFIIRQEGNGKRNSLGQSENLYMTTKPDCKKLQKKSVKRQASSPNSKRARTDQTECLVTSHLTKCTSPEKSRLSKQKGSQDAKRCDRKNIRVSGKSKFDSFVSKNGLSSSDFGAGGNNVLGIYGLKSDFHDVTKDMVELSLGELLDGGYKSPNLCPGKGKRGSSVNENIAVSVRKAYSILPVCNSVYQNNKKETYSPSSKTCSTNVTDQDDGDKCTDSVPPSKDSNSETPIKSALYQPKDILERLALPTAQDLDFLLQDQNLISSTPLHIGNDELNICSASLPPFSWSSSHSGPWKPPTDAGKSTNRYYNQGRWVRIGNYSSLNSNDHICCLNQLEWRSSDSNGVSKKQRELDELLQNAKTLTMSYTLPPSVSSGVSCKVSDSLKSHILDDRASVKSSTASESGNSFDLNFLDIKADSSGNIKFDSKESVHKMVTDKGSLLYQRNETNMADPSSADFTICAAAVCGQEHLAKGTHGGYDNASYSCKNGIDGNGQNLWRNSGSEIFKSGYSPRMLAAAEILCEIGRHSDIHRKQNGISEKVRWPNSPLQITMKARKPRPLTEKIDGLSFESRSIIPVKMSRISSPQHKPFASDKKSKPLSLKNVGREPIRWPAAAEGAYPVRLDRDSSTNTKPLHGNAIRQIELMPPPPRPEKGKDSHPKTRKEIVTTTSYTSTGLCVKDWSRVRSRRE